MALQKYHFYLTTDFDNPDSDPVFADGLKQVLKQAWTMARLMSGRRKPTVMLEIGDQFFAEEDVDLFADAGGENG